MSQMDLFSNIVSFCKRRGFVYPTSEIYGGISNSYDYGPYGAQLLKNIRSIWWKTFVEDRDDMLGLDTQIIQHPQTWVASGHVGSFTDPLVEDKINHKRYRADHLIENWAEKNKKDITVEDMKLDEMASYIVENNIRSPEGNELTEPKAFNLLFETEIGTVSGDKSKVYLRGETAQGIFSNYKQITDSCRVKLPFGVGQIGKSFRNEITQGQFIFRTFEFEQAEIEYFFDPNTSDWKLLMDQWKKDMMDFLINDLGISSEKLRWRQHTDKERSHYSKDTYDIDFEFSFGWKELWGIAYRTDYDLNQHIQHSGKPLQWVKPDGSKFTPHVIEPAVGINRLFFMLLTQAYYEEDLGEGKTRTVLKLKPSIAPVKVAIFPLQKDEKLDILASSVYKDLRKLFTCEYDNSGNIGKMYRRQDEIGTPYCLVIDYESLEDNCLTIRDRDTMKQVRVPIVEVKTWLIQKIHE